MRIEDEKLIDLLVKETGQSKGKVKDQLDQLKNRIMRAARTGGVVEISDFGTFATKNNVLDFVPSKQLKTEINQKYAGMRAIEIMEPYKAAGAGVPVDDRRYEPPPAPASKREVPKTNRKNTDRASEEETLSAAARGPDGNIGNFEQNWEEQQEKEKDLSRVYREQEKQESGQSEFRQEGRQNNRPSEPYVPQKEKSSTSKLLVTVMTAAAILLAGWLLYESGTLKIPGLESNNNAPIAADTNEQTAAQSQSSMQNQPETQDRTQAQDQLQQPQQNTPPPGAGDSVADIGVGAAGGGEQQTAAGDGNAGSNGTENIVETQQPAAERYGLRGAVDGALSGEFTIIVHSFRLKSTVEDLSVQLKQEGYRTVISESAGADGSRWRLGLGQFPTRVAAEEAAQQLPEPYVNNYFIDQI